MKGGGRVLATLINYTYGSISSNDYPIQDNSDNSTYISMGNNKVYNSAVLEYDGKTYWIMIFQSSTTVSNSYSGTSMNFNKQGHNCYTRDLSGDYYWITSTVGGVEIYYSDSENMGCSTEVMMKFNNPTEYMAYITTPLVTNITSNGGGATHIAKVTGQLQDLSSNLSDILIVSGGGGGGLLAGNTAYAGADAGGVSGSGSNSGNQSAGYAFGQGESGTNKSGGGSGLYGGYKGNA